MRFMRFALLLLAALSAGADEFDDHRAAVLEQLIREVPAEHRAGGVFVRAMDHCTSDPRRHDGCVDLSDAVLKKLRRAGFDVDRVPLGSRYYIYGDPAKHRDDPSAPPPDWLYLPMYTPGAEWRTHCQVRLVYGFTPEPGGVHFNGHCSSRKAENPILSSGDFIATRGRRGVQVRRFEPPPGCILPQPPPP